MRFKFHIENEEGDIIVGGSTFISKINEYGECESVDEEVGRALRYVRKHTQKNNSVSNPDTLEVITNL